MGLKLTDATDQTSCEASAFGSDALDDSTRFPFSVEATMLRTQTELVSSAWSDGKSDASPPAVARSREDGAAGGLEGTGAASKGAGGAPITGDAVAPKAAAPVALEGACSEGSTEGAGVLAGAGAASAGAESLAFDSVSIMGWRCK